MRILYIVCMVGLWCQSCFLFSSNDPLPVEALREGLEQLQEADELFEKRQFADAKELYEKGLLNRPALSLQAYARLASIYESEGNLMQAIRVYSRGSAYIGYQAENRSYYLKYGRLCKQAKLYDKAIFAFRRILKFHPDDLEVRAEMMEVNHFIKKQEKNGK